MTIGQDDMHTRYATHHAGCLYCDTALEAKMAALQAYFNGFFVINIILTSVNNANDTKFDRNDWTKAWVRANAS